MQLSHLKTVKLLAYSACLLINDISFASAWLQPKGASELILQLEKKDLTAYFKDTDNSDLTNSNKFAFDYYSLFYRYGLKKEITLGFDAQWFNYKSYINSSPYNTNSILLKNNTPNASYIRGNELYLDSHFKKYESNILEYSFFGQREFWSDETSVISIKSSVGSFAEEGKINMGGLAILFGHSFKLGEKDYHINIEFGGDNLFYSSLVDVNSTDSIRAKLDVTLGAALSKKQTILIQSFNHTDPIQALKNPNDPKYSRLFCNILQVSWVYKYSPNAYWQTGYSTNITQRDNYIADSIITGIWMKF